MSWRIFTLEIDAMTCNDGFFYMSWHVNWNLTCKSEGRDVDKIIAKIKRSFIEEKCIAEKRYNVCIFVIQLSIWLNNMWYCCRCNMIRTSTSPEDGNAYIKWSKVVFYHLFPAPFWPQLFDAILLAKTFQGHQRRRIMLTYPCNADPLHPPLYSELWVHKIYTFFCFAH